MVDLEGTTISETERELLLRPEVGGVILFTRNFESVEQITALVADIHALRDPRLLVAVDHEGGRVQRFHNGFTRLAPAAVYAKIAHGEHPTPVAVALVLTGRFYKRILGHLTNIATSVVVPADRVDYYDEPE